MPIELKIFYSWESDLPAEIGRDFIFDALNIAVKSIEESTDGNIKIRIEQDARGRSGTPDLAAEVFRKIQEADIFIGDVSIIGEAIFEDQRRLVPNPNVMIEHGFALRHHGPENVLAVCNDLLGRPEDLPFDIRHRRVIRFRAKRDDKDLDIVRINLAGEFERDIRLLAGKLSTKAVLEDNLETIARSAVEQVAKNGPGAVKILGRLWDEYLKAIDQIDLGKSHDSADDDAFVLALEKSLRIQRPFYDVLDAIAEHNNLDAVIMLVSKFGLFVDRYSFKGSGRYNRTDFDLYKFLGHEIAAALFGLLLKFKRWEMLDAVLSEKFLVSHFHTGSPEMLDFSEVNQHVEILRIRNERLSLRRLSLHGDILKERHQSGPLAEILNAQDFREGDLIAYFWFYIRAGAKSSFGWLPWSSIWLIDDVPRILVEARVKSKALPIMKLLGVSSDIEFRGKLKDACFHLSTIWGHYWSNPLVRIDFEKLASE